MSSAASFPDGGGANRTAANAAAGGGSAIDDLLGLENEISAIQVRLYDFQQF